MSRINSVSAELSVKNVSLPRGLVKMSEPERYLQKCLSGSLVHNYDFVCLFVLRLSDQVRHKRACKVAEERLEAENFGLKKKRYCNSHAAKRKALISCAISAPASLFFAYANFWFAHDAAHK